MSLAVVLGIVGILLLGIALAQPLYVLLGALSGLLLLVGTNLFSDFASLDILIEQTRALSDNEVLLAIPFFIISGALMSAGDISRRLVEFAGVGFRGVPGALAVSAVMGCIFFAAISGSSPVTVIAIGSIVYPSLVSQRYNSNFSAGLLASAGSLGILIPPSIPMIIYSIVDPEGLMDPANYNLAKAGQSTGLTDLFLAGVGPAIMLGLVFVVASIMHGAGIVEELQQRPTMGERAVKVLRGIGRFLLRLPAMVLVIFTGAWVLILLAARYLNSVPSWLEEGRWLRDFSESFWASFWALMLPAIILGGIYSGLFTPTEAACVSVVYAVLVEVFIYRSITFRGIPAVLTESTVLIGALLVILAVAQGFTLYLEEAEIPQKLVQFILAKQLSTVNFLIVVNLMLLVVGALMDIMSAIMILVPLLSPVAFQLGIHPLHLAIIFIVNLEIGYLTPPLGMNLFVASTIFRKSFGEMIRAVVPFIGMMLACLVVVTYVPSISLGPVSYINGHGTFYVPFPERKVPLGKLTIHEDITFLSRMADKGLGDLEDLDKKEEEAEQTSGRALSMAEITALAHEREQQAATEALTYDNVNDLIADFARLHYRETTLQKLLIELEDAADRAAKDLDIDPVEDDDYDPYADDDDDFDPYADDSDDFDPYANDDDDFDPYANDDDDFDPYANDADDDFDPYVDED